MTQVAQEVECFWPEIHEKVAQEQRAERNHLRDRDRNFMKDVRDFMVYLDKAYPEFAVPKPVPQYHTKPEYKYTYSGSSSGYAMGLATGMLLGAAT